MMRRLVRDALLKIVGMRKEVEILNLARRAESVRLVDDEGDNKVTFFMNRNDYRKFQERVEENRKMMGKIVSAEEEQMPGRDEKGLGGISIQEMRELLGAEGRITHANKNGEGEEVLKEVGKNGWNGNGVWGWVRKWLSF